MKAVFLDRDGVINEVVWRNGQPASPRNLKEWKLNEAWLPIMASLKEQGWKIFIVTNQPDVARKLLDWEQLDQMHQEIVSKFPIDEIAVCPHDDQDNCSCRKPKPGMLLQLAEAWEIDLAHSWFIGDTWKDMSAAKAAGCKTILLAASYNEKVESDFRIQDPAMCLALIK